SATDRLQAIAGTPPLKFIEQRGHQPRATGTQRVTQRNGSAVDVELVMRHTGFLHPGKRYRREGLVDLEKVDVADGQTSLAQHLLGRLDRAGQHQRWVCTYGREGADARASLEAQLLGGVRGHQQQRSGAIGYLRGITCSDPPVLRAETGFQRRELFPRGIATDGFVRRQISCWFGQRVLTHRLDRYRNDLAIEITRISCLRGTLMTFESVVVQRFATE